MSICFFASLSGANLSCNKTYTDLSMVPLQYMSTCSVQAKAILQPPLTETDTIKVTVYILSDQQVDLVFCEPNVNNPTLTAKSHSIKETVSPVEVKWNVHLIPNSLALTLLLSGRGISCFVLVNENKLYPFRLVISSVNSVQVPLISKWISSADQQDFEILFQSLEFKYFEGFYYVVVSLSVLTVLVFFVFVLVTMRHKRTK